MEFLSFYPSTLINYYIFYHTIEPTFKFIVLVKRCPQNNALRFNYILFLQLFNTSL